LEATALLLAGKNSKRSPLKFQYVTRHPDTLLPRFYGVYSMKHEGIGGVTRFVVMNNVFNSPYEPVEKFDLKVVRRQTDSNPLLAVCSDPHY
jgi:1-phosphatidylinositol-4-phosphate 5-kinase